MCTIIGVKCSWDGLLEGRNCSCVWSFWYSELCSIGQTVTVQRGSVLDVRGPEWFCQPFFSIWISTVLGEWGGLYQWFAQQSSEVRFGSWAEPDSYWCAEDWFNDGRVELGGGGGGGGHHDHFQCFEHVQLQVVKTAPDSQLLSLLSVSRLVTVLDEADQCDVSSANFRSLTEGS